MSATPVFLYGTLRDPAMLAAVLGRMPERGELRPARLPGHAVRRAADTGWPALVPEPGAAAEGLVLGSTHEDRARLDYIEAGWGYRRQPVELRLSEGGPLRAECYFPPAPLPPTYGPWSLPEWQARFGALAPLAAREMLSFRGSEPPEQAARRWPQMLARAQSRVAAEADPGPLRLRSGLARGDVGLRAARRPYARFFSVEEHDLDLPRLGGGRMAQDNRAVFVAVDAVTVLPYDPRRDRVLVVEQFRMGPWGRGDPHPWTLEPIAGRRDPGESLEATARREAREEAGVTLAGLEHVASYYPSPGAYSEFVTSYVGLADLPEQGSALHGLDAEAEDIRAHVLGFGALMAAVRSGEVRTAPLILCALWLAEHRQRLVAAQGGGA